MTHRIASRLQEVSARKPSWLKRPDENEAVWILRTPGLFRRRSIKEVDALKSELLSMLFGSGDALLITSEVENLPSDWERLGGNTLRIPEGVELTEESLARVLFVLGDWCAYVAAKPFLGDWVDPFRSEPDVLRDWMNTRGIKALIAAWPDDTEWVIALTRRKRRDS